MTNKDIISLRLQHQLINSSHLMSPAEVVKHMVAMQAQDYRSSLLAIGLRISPSVATDECMVEQAVAEKRLVRTWPMRGTLHWVAAEDARWMLKLLAPRVIQSSQGRHKQLELDEAVFAKSRIILESNLEGGKPLTRAQIYALLEQEGIPTHDQRGIHILGYWAMKGLLCQGIKRDKNDTFVLMDEWLPRAGELGEEEALATLAERYIKSRGPASEYDFASWAGLKISDARRGLDMAKPSLKKIIIEGNTFWLSDRSDNSNSSTNQRAWLLPAFDEMLCGYKDRTALLPNDEIKSIILKNGIFKPVVVLDNRAVGIWQRTIKVNQINVAFSFFNEISSPKKQLIWRKAKSLESFFKREIVIAD